MSAPANWDMLVIFIITQDTPYSYVRLKTQQAFKLESDVFTQKANASL